MKSLLYQVSSHVYYILDSLVNILVLWFFYVSSKVLQTDILVWHIIALVENIGFFRFVFSKCGEASLNQNTVFRLRNDPHFPHTVLNKLHSTISDGSDCFCVTDY